MVKAVHLENLVNVRHLSYLAEVKQKNSLSRVASVVYIHCNGLGESSFADSFCTMDSYHFYFRLFQTLVDFMHLVPPSDDWQSWLRNIRWPHDVGVVLNLTNLQMHPHVCAVAIEDPHS